MNTFWVIVFAVGAAQGVFLCGVLLLRREANHRATRLLGALIGVATTMIVASALVEELPVSYDQLFIFLNINTELVFGPLMLLFARALVEPTRKLLPKDALHFAPLAGAMAFWALAWLALGEPQRRLAFLASGPVVPLYMVLKLGWSLVYMAATHRLLGCEKRVSRIELPGRKPVRLQWMRHAVLALTAMVAVIYAVAFAERFGLESPLEADPFASLGLAVMVYMVSAMVVQRPWIFALRSRPVADGRWKRETKQIERHLESERPWTDPGLGLADLAQALGLSENRLSTVLREGLDTSFYGLLTRYRLAEFERLAREPSTRHRSVLELAYEAGFNSKAAFYRAFRETHQTTPTAFRNAV